MTGHSGLFAVRSRPARTADDPHGPPTPCAAGRHRLDERTNSHLHKIRAPDVGWGSPDPDFGDGPLDASKARLTDMLEDVGARSLKYLYDFGNGWEHSARIERITDTGPGIVASSTRALSKQPDAARQRCWRPLGIPRIPLCERHSRTQGTRRDAAMALASTDAPSSNDPDRCRYPREFNPPAVCPYPSSHGRS